MKIEFVIPAFNENGNLQPLVSSIDRQCKKLGISYSILLILQGDDGSRKTVTKLKRKYPVRFLYFPLPLGIGYAYREGFSHILASSTHIITMDADRNHNPSVLPLFIASMKENHADIVVGSRFIRNGSFAEPRLWKRWLSTIVNSLLTHLLGLPVHDISSGYRLIKKEAVMTIRNRLQEKNYPGYMEFILRAKSDNMRISEVPITYTPRTWGVSKMRAFDTLADYIGFVIRQTVFHS